MSDLSASDVLAMTKDKSGFLEGNGIIILLLFLLFLGGGNFGGMNNGSALQGAMTRAEMQDGFNNQNTVNTLNNLSIGMNNGFNGLAMGMNNGFNSVNMNLTNGFNGVQSSLAQLGFNMQNCCCEIKTMMQDNVVQNLRDKVADKDRELNSAIFAASQLTQTKTLEDFILANK